MKEREIIHCFCDLLHDLPKKLATSVNGERIAKRSNIISINIFDQPNQHFHRYTAFFCRITVEIYERTVVSVSIHGFRFYSLGKVNPRTCKDLGKFLRQIALFQLQYVIVLKYTRGGFTVAGVTSR